MNDLYKKIEAKIRKMKERETKWKKNYDELSRQVKDLVEFNAEQINGMSKKIGSSERNLDLLASRLKKSNVLMGDRIGIIEKKVDDALSASRGARKEMEDKEKEMKGIKADAVLQIRELMSKHEKAVDAAMGQINAALGKMQDMLTRWSEMQEKMDSSRKFFESYTPPANVPQAGADAAFPAPAPVPQRLGKDAPGLPFMYGAGRGHTRPQVVMDDFDDDMDVDDLISGKEDFPNPAENISKNVNAISDKLARLESAVSRIRESRNPDLTRIDDKIQMYGDSVDDVRRRMNALERAMKEGMNPMMDSMKTLVEAVKELKEKQSGTRPMKKITVPRPEPPRRRG